MHELILVRHGQADHLIRGLTGGWTESHLTQIGQQQAMLTGQRLLSLLDDKSYHFLCSDLARTLETAEIIGDYLGVSPHPEKALRGPNNGAAANKTVQEANAIKLEKTEPIIDWIPFPGAESWRMLFRRVSTYLDEIKNLEVDVLLIVSNSGMIEAAIFWWLELPEPMQSKVSFKFDLCSISCLGINEWGAKMIGQLNDTAHIRSLKAEI